MKTSPMPEEYVSLQRTCEMLKCSYASLQRYRRRGCHGVFLRTAKVGGRRVTTRQWVQEFIDKVTASADGERAAESLNEAERDAARGRMVADRIMQG